ncbi:N-formylglutamate amidohydrolase [Oceanihabitans sediminis]|uniref:N-formylglutamate amidohydrolase n=1 Tax=Oceanihabitans sediminis TaxID=1812012 RepID=A0A368P468_9FLAO|nr:N-formylglutamate amidohydrolase [Oceanihabitans sediminis]MDX1278629.1 N-formylglutamate amidohydrolase [Oceanihabitans sediminis]MDX1774298.1 N-formylglutamate amidohydrolase [Oceanihabitans sediminis]RBP29900.1 putative N-formylglutamate amidohydrolase [Oceanihabitans sediminis]RCU57236.1 N-formylglutamate amidohydrolase [Oceanihabitans sediminis]
MKLILTCEHGGNKVPKKYQSYFNNQEVVLNSHRGYDIGALDVFNHLKPLANFSKHSETTRLLIELNRSLHHKNLFSEFSKSLIEEEKDELITQYYLDYRDEVEAVLKKHTEAAIKVTHLSIHTFTPIWNETERNCDIGLLFDSRIKSEKTFCKNLKKEIQKIDKTLNIRFNYPYLGKADGFTTYLRKQLPSNYLGIEIEINQKFASNNKIDLNLKATLFSAIQSLCK